MSAADPEEDGLRPLIGQRSLAEEAADVIREQIMSGRFRRGEHLVETKLARELRISRGPIRDAFKLLRAEGLVAEEPRRGTFVATLTTKDVSEIYDLRAALESAAARSLARSGNVEAVAELQAVLDTLSSAVAANDVRAVARADLAFHDTLCRLSENARLHTVFQQTVPALRTLLLVDQHLYSAREIPDQHRPILEAITAGDATLAAAVVEAHVRQAKEQVLAFLASTPTDPEQAL